MREVNLKELAIYKNDKPRTIIMKGFRDGFWEETNVVKFYKPENIGENIDVGAYVTWYDDPSTSIMIHYQVINTILGADSYVECQLRKLGELNWHTILLFANKTFPYTNKKVKWFKAEGLSPDTIYETKLKGHDQIYKFKTMPSTHTRDIKISLISDQRGFKNMDIEEKNFAVEAPQQFQALYENCTDVITLAGDGVHDNGTRYDYWEEFWEVYFKVCDDNDGLMLPILYCFGNHDGITYNQDGTRKDFLWYHSGSRKENVVFQYEFFSNLNELGYGAIDIGNYMSILFLNSNHTVPIIGDQVTWLSEALLSRQGRHIFPFFHVTPYPLYYGYSEGYSSDQSKQIRDNWAPLFSQYGVKVVGVGHDHTSIVTKKVTGDNVDEINGIIYTGQGHCAGAETRALDGRDLWYVDYYSTETKGLSIMSFKPNNSVEINRIGLDGTILYNKTI